MRSMRARCRLLAPLLVLALGAFACARTTPIAQIKKQPDEMRGKQVTVAGEVIDTLDLPLLRHHYYHVDDGTGQLWVQTSEKLPAQGDHLQITGKLEPGLHIPGLDVGLVLDEEARE
jgi:hypothetical protein